MGQKLSRNTYNPTCSELYELGMPSLSFSNACSPSCPNTSDHTPVEHFEEMVTFSILEECKKTNSSKNLMYGSGILNNPSVRMRHVEFTSEADIQALVGTLLIDIVVMIDKRKRMHVRNECSYTNEKKSKHTFHKADHWVLYSNSRPITLTVAKSPGADVTHAAIVKGKKKQRTEEHILDNKHAFGQIFDYILNLKTFHGQDHVFAILTTMKDFRVVWLPCSDAFAAANNIVPVHDSAQADMAERILHGTPIIAHDDPQLPKILMTAIMKSAASTFSTVHAFSAERMYLRLNADGWLWHRLSAAGATCLHDHATLQLTQQANRSAHYTVIKCLQRQPYCKVWVAMAGDTRQVCIVKQMETAKLVDREVAIWKSANKHPGVYSSVAGGRPVAVLPYVVLAHQVNSRVVFNTDYHRWAVQGNATAGPVPVTILRQLERVGELIRTEGWTVQRAADVAVARFAACGILHEDLEWRHIGMVPLFDVAGDVAGVLPVLIDFDRCETDVDQGRALQEMQAQLHALAVGIEFA